MNFKILSRAMLVVLCFAFATASAQKGGIYVDKTGVIRWKDSNKEAAFFGVNYTVPFAYGYRSHKALGVDPEQAIRQDVYHMARLGLDAFRVHVWDTEITDSAGNLLQNEHLRLFDFLLAELKKRKIKILVTPIAFWGNGYPEKDEATPGFSAKFGKGASVVKEEAIRAQENYMKQFFAHVNPYTGKSYIQDEDIIATEINNEPHHSGTKALAKEYVNRLAAAIRSTGWTKPVFYNISESPWYSDAVANADVDGVSFQWYPSGLVANHTLKGNFLPHVDKFQIPFDSIPAYKNKAKMVYEFDAGDIMTPVMYPAMARSFRTAGFQWATQFAYDPLATAYANTEYQTHYLNLAYTPSKAISLLIANKVFHNVPRLKSYGTYPQSSSFEMFRLSYEEALSEMNTSSEFYYSNNTSSKPMNPAKLSKIAGVGSSPVVKYTGTGAYFLDKIENGVWRLEVMPDAVLIRDPFEKASLRKEVTRIEWKTREMTVSLPDLGSDFELKPLTGHQQYSSKTNKGSFSVSPGTYLVLKKGKAFNRNDMMIGALGLAEFVAPRTLQKDVIVGHTPPSAVSANREFTIKATIAGLTDSAKVTLYINQLAGQYKTIPMRAVSAYEFAATLPADFLVPGLLNYRIGIEQGGGHFVFPGNHKEDPWAWDNYTTDTWKAYVAAPGSSIKIYNAGIDQQIRPVPNWDKEIKASYVTADNAQQLLYRVQSEKALNGKIAGFELFIGDKLSSRIAEGHLFNSLSLRARALTEGTKLRIALITSSGQAYSAYADLKTELNVFEIPLTDFKEDKSLLLPRPYPGFQPLWFEAAGSRSLDFSAIEKLEISIGSDADSASKNSLQGFELESVELKQSSKHLSAR